MSRRALWPIVLPLSGGGILLGHLTAYRLLGVDPGSVHAYLTHAPQVLLALLVPAVVVASASTPSSPRPWLFAMLGVGGFTLMEHVELILHAELPWLLMRPVFLLGLVLQLPFGLLAWWLARLLMRMHVVPARPLRRLPRLVLALSCVTRTLSGLASDPLGRPRGPPLLA